MNTNYTTKCHTRPSSFIFKTLWRQLDWRHEDLPHRWQISPLLKYVPHHQTKTLSQPPFSFLQELWTCLFVFGTPCKGSTPFWGVLVASHHFVGIYKYVNVLLGFLKSPKNMILSHYTTLRTLDNLLPSNNPTTLLLLLTI